MSSDKPKKKKQWRWQIELGPLSIMLWGIVILFFLAWIFVLGIFAGRGALPGSLTDLFELKGDNNKLQESVDTIDSNAGVSTEPELAFYDKLTTKKDDARNNILTETPAETDRVISQPIKPVEDQPASDKKEAAQASDSMPVSGSGQFTVQVASISGLAKAEKTVNQLIAKGFDAYYYETRVKGKKTYRVRCGKFADRAAAVKCLNKLEEKTGLKEGYVTDIE
jgi:septal ring-binding cell division protein DamX